MTYSGDFDLRGAYAYMEFNYTPPVRPTFNDDGCDEELEITYFVIKGSDNLAGTELVDEVLWNDIDEECRKIIASEMHEAQIEAARHRKQQIEDGYDLDGVA